MESTTGWAAIYQAVAQRMLNYLNKSELLKVNFRELEFRVLAPNEPNIDIEHTVMQARGETKGCSRLSVGKEQMRFCSPVWREGREHQRMLIILEQKSQELCQAIVQRSERQKLIAARLAGVSGI